MGETAERAAVRPSTVSVFGVTGTEIMALKRIGCSFSNQLTCIGVAVFFFLFEEVGT
jgi:hypothetical protein